MDSASERPIQVQATIGPAASIISEIWCGSVVRLQNLSPVGSPPRTI